MSVKTKEAILAVIGIVIVAALITVAGPFDKMFANASNEVASVASSGYHSVSEKVSSLFADDDAGVETTGADAESSAVKDGVIDEDNSSSNAAVTPAEPPAKETGNDSDGQASSVESQIKQAEDLGVANPLRATPEVMAMINRAIAENPTASGG